MSVVRSTTPIRATSRSFRHWGARVSALVVGAVLLAGCGGRSSRPLTTWDPAGKQSTLIDNLTRPVFLVAGVVFVLVQGVIVAVVIVFRRRKDDDGRDPRQTHGNNPLEIAWTIAPAVLLAALAVLNVRAIFDLEEYDKAGAMKVEVIGQQWWWEFRYDTDGDEQPDIITANQMVIPTGRDVVVRITSNDVIHSFWIPALNGKKDAVPGHTHQLVFHADEEGMFEGQCTEFCGLSHGYMRMQVKAVSPADYDSWVADQVKPAPSAAELSSDLAREGQKEFASRCAYCHQVNGLAEGSDGKPDPTYRGLKDDTDPLVRAGNAPNLTHLMSRERFAGNMFPLYDEKGKPNVGELEEWVRAPDSKKPMNATRRAARGNEQGMPNLGLDQATIDKLVAYLTDLK